jgi:hypothetical protein
MFVILCEFIVLEDTVEKKTQRLFVNNHSFERLTKKKQNLSKVHRTQSFEWRSFCKQPKYNSQTNFMVQLVE